METKYKLSEVWGLTIYSLTDIVATIATIWYLYHGHRHAAIELWIVSELASMKVIWYKKEMKI